MRVIPLQTIFLRKVVKFRSRRLHPGTTQHGAETGLQEARPWAAASGERGRLEHDAVAALWRAIGTSVFVNIKEVVVYKMIR